MRALNQNSSLLAPQTFWLAGIRQDFESARLAEIRRREREYKNRGNEAKKWLKTKDITFLNAPNYAHLTRRFAQIER
jgi:hypothetical protein